MNFSGKIITLISDSIISSFQQNPMRPTKILKNNTNILVLYRYFQHLTC